MYQMPNLSDFAADNITFFNHYATSNNRMSLFGLFYGIPSSYENGIQGQQTAPLFLDVMKQQGYNFGLFTANHIQDNYYRTLMDQTNDVGIPRYDPETYRDKQALADWQIWLKDNASSPWFSYIELATIKNFEDYEVANKEAPPAEQLKSAYSAAATELDQTIAPLFDYLKEQALLENTIVIITSNHGTEFNETNTNSWGANTNYSRYQLGVPLVIHWPGKEPDLLMHKSSHFDISVTLLQDLLGVASNPQEFSSGRNLFDKSKRKWVLASSANEIAVITDEVTTVVDKYGNYKVYDSNYKRQKEAKTKLSILMQGLSELKRFYSREQE